MYSQFTQRVVGQTGGFDFVAAHFDCESNLYTRDNPDGYVNFGSAQNFIHHEWITELGRQCQWDVDDAHYEPFEGTNACREAITRFISRMMPDGGSGLNASNVVVGNGIISLLEALGIALLDPGDSVLVPTPVFPGLVGALSTRMRSDVRFFHTQPESDFQLNPAELEEHMDRLRQSGIRVKAILICSPGNPVGQVFTAEELRRLLALAEAFDCHLIVDEVYAGSVLNGAEFVTASGLGSDRIHVLGGLSKDFGLAGYATGWLATRNEPVLNAMRKQAHFYRLPTPIQRVIVSLLDGQLCDAYLAAHRQKLGERMFDATKGLSKVGIPVSSCQAGLCVWLDFRNYVNAPSKEAEVSLYQHLLREHRVHISPGSGFFTNQYGFFRACISQREDTLLEGIRRIESALSSICVDRFLSRTTEAIS